ncbi:MAG: XdhC/CoxI family protein, partial [Cytophagaceae bacterium]|nr:XdhC/CoxI family protein [Cytophagaceae bacterium]
ARMFITDDGQWTGAVSGGCLEGDALRQARDVMRLGKARLVTYDTTNDDENAFGIGLGCNGIIDILIEPIQPGDNDNPLALLGRLLIERQPTAMVTVVIADEPERVGQRLIVDADGNTTSTIPDRIFAEKIHTLAQSALATERSSLDLIAGVTVFAEVLIPDIQLIVFGAGYDVIPLVAQAKLLGWAVTVTDDCVAHLSPKKFAACDNLLYAPREEVMGKLRPDGRTAAVLMTHNFNYDRAVLPHLLQSGVPYIGILGPKKRGDKLLEALGGAAYRDQTRIHSPIGLDLGAETPEEIALSVVAEIQACFNRRDGQMLKFRNAPIHVPAS